MSSSLFAPEAAPYEVINPDGRAGMVILCDHASAVIPARYAELGLPAAERARHIAWDIGAAEVARRLSARFDAPGVLGGTSRLVIDLNRPLDDPTSIPYQSDGAAIPGNADVDAIEAAGRAERYFWPYHRAIEAVFGSLGLARAEPVVVFIHSFTPVMAGVKRPWEIGILWDRDGRLAQPLIAELRRDSGLTVGDNEPYSGASPQSFSLRTHGEGPGRQHVSIEFRQDLIATSEGAAVWAQRLGDALARVLAARHLPLPRRAD